MKTVWIVNHYAQTPLGVGGTRHFQLAKSLLREGWKACIIAASTEYSTGFQRLVQGERVRLEVVDEIPFLWLHSPVYQGNGFGRIANMLVFSLRLLGKDPIHHLPTPDVIIGSSVHPFAVLSAEILARRFKIPFVFEVRDLWPQTLIDFGLIKYHSFTARLLRVLEVYLYRRASRIVVLLPFAYRYIERFGIDADKIVWIPNGVDLDAWPILNSDQRSSNNMILMYFGAFGQANALDILLLAMHELQAMPEPPSVHVRLIGSGPLRDDLIERARALGLINISFEDPVPKKDIPRLAAGADVLWANTIDSPLYKYGISLNKIYDYLAAARPVIFGCAAANNPVAAASAGIVVSPGNPSVLADAIAEMASLSPEVRNRMGLAGRAYVEREHNSQRLAKRLACVLNSCLSGCVSSK